MLNLNPCGDLTPEVLGQEDFSFKVLGFFVDINGDKTAASDVYIAIHNIGADYLECYSPTEQHGSIDEGYINACERITKEEYLAASKGFFTPPDYLVKEGV